MNPAFTVDQTNYMRSASDDAAVLFFTPNTPIFQAQVAAVPPGNDNYLQVSYDTVSIGAYTDIHVGQTVMISATSDHTQYLWRGRIADTPTSGILYIDESDAEIALDMYITVIDTYDVNNMERIGDLIDGRHPFEDLPPVIEGVRSVYVVWTSGVVSGSLSISPIGRAMADGASIVSYSWDIPGVTYTTGSSSTQNIVITVPHGHRWGRLTVVDSNDVEHWVVFEIYVQDPDAPTLGWMNVDRLRLNRGPNGHHCSVAVYDSVLRSQVLDACRVTLASYPTFEGGDPGLDPVMFVGYITKDTSVTTPEEKTVSFEIGGLWELAAKLPFNPVGIRDLLTPENWDDITLATIQRAIWHVIRRYSMMGHLASFSFFTTSEAAAPNTWYAHDIDVDASGIGEACTSVGSSINARLLGNPSGHMYLRRRASMLETSAERDSLDVLMTLTEADFRDFNMEREHGDRVGQITIGWGSYQTNGGDVRGGRASAPSVRLGTASEKQTFVNQLMPADLTLSELLDDEDGLVQKRAGNLLAAANPPYAPTFGTRDGFASLTPSDYQWINLTVEEETTGRGIALEEARQMLDAVELSYDTRDATYEVEFELTPETIGGNARVLGLLTPDAQPLEMTVRPTLDAYDGLISDGSHNYPEVDSTPGPFRRENFSGMGSTLPADQAAEIAALSPNPGETAFAISFKNPDPVGAGFTSEPGEKYLITLSGSAQIGDLAELIETYNFTESDHGFVGLPVITGLPYAIYHTGEGFAHGTDDIARIGIQKDLQHQYTRAVFTFNEVMAAGTPFCAVLDYPFPGYNLVAQVNAVDDVFDVGPYAPTDGFSCDTGQAGAILTDTIRLIKLELTRADGSEDREADAFYSWKRDANGNEIDVQAHVGLVINASFTPPLYDPTHKYTIEVDGTGSEFEFVFYDTDYDDNQNVPLSIRIKGPGAGK